MPDLQLRGRKGCRLWLGVLTARTLMDDPSNDFTKETFIDGPAFALWFMFWSINFLFNTSYKILLITITLLYILWD